MGAITHYSQRGEAMMKQEKIGRRTNTKERIFYTAVELFSENGYNKISVRDIAKAVGITVSSLYNHYGSKEEIINSLYDFFAEHWQAVCPKLPELLKLAETEPPLEVLMMLDFRCEPEHQETMGRIMRIAAQQVGLDANNARFIKENVMDRSENTLRPLLAYMAEAGRIEPLDVDALVSVLLYYSVGGALLNHSSMHIELGQWRAGLQFIFSAVKPVAEVISNGE